MKNKVCKYCGTSDNLRIDKLGRIYSVCVTCYHINKHNELLKRWENTSKEEKIRIKEKREQTNFEKFGVKHAAQNKDILNKMKETCLERYGVENTYQLKEKMEIAKQTKLERYGDENYNNMDKLRQTSLERYGVDIPAKSQHVKDLISFISLNKSITEKAEIQKKRIFTCLERYGETHVMHVQEFFDKSQQCTNKNHKWYKHILPSGKIISLQGYERYAIKFLLNEFGENDLELIKANIPKIKYIDFDGKTRKYYPDFYIKSTNTIVEVKSFYTYSLEIIQNILKQQSTLDNGYNYRLIII